ncbi:hypothetical protein [Kitasatospora aureofaciens]|uniref:hypothetical protein n=1 Tax=Kitasatospora aureofaciens TaxID=1894 RepID=UPI00382F3332
MNDRDDTRNTISGGTIHGNVVMGGRVSVVESLRGHLRMLVAVASAMALVGAGTTYYALHATGGAEGPKLSARQEPGHRDAHITVVLPRAVRPSDLPPATGCPATRTWLHAQGGTDTGQSALTVEMVGNGHTVAIEGLRATVVGTPGDPLPGTVVNCSEQGEGEKIDLGVDLDSDDRVALISSAGPVSFAPYFSDKYLYLEDRKPELINLSVLATRHSYDYVITVEGSVDGEHHTWTLKDGDRPFHISGVRGERTNALWNRGQGWETSYAASHGAPTRCNPCYDQEEQVIPRTAVGGAPPGFTFTAVPATDPAKRPTAATPPLTVDEYDAESVAIAWAVTSGSIDTGGGDTGPAAVLPRVRRYLTRELADSGGGLNPLAPDGGGWPPEVTVHQGWSVAQWVSAAPLEGTKDRPGYLTGDAVGLEVSVTCGYWAADGWSSAAKSFFGRLRMQRQSDGTYRIAAIEEKKFSFPQPTDPPQ